MVTQGLVDNAVHDWLAGDPAIVAALGASRIYSDAAPPGVVLPYIVYRVSGGGTENDSPRDAADIVVSVIAAATTGGLATTLADLIKARMHRAEIPAGSGWHDFRSEEIGIVQYMEYLESKLYWRRGGNYRLRTAKTSV